MLALVLVGDSMQATSAAIEASHAGLIPITPEIWAGGATPELIERVVPLASLLIVTDPDSVEHVTYGAQIDKAIQLAERYDVPVVYYRDDTLELHPTEVRYPQQSEMFRVVLGQMYRTYLKKNLDYSPANIGGMGEIGFGVRVWDKVARLLNLLGFELEASLKGYAKPVQPKYESLEDTLLDLSVYGIIGRIVRAGKWGR